jgi:hypothetical protein
LQALSGVRLAQLRYEAVTDALCVADIQVSETFKQLDTVDDALVG